MDKVFKKKVQATLDLLIANKSLAESDAHTLLEEVIKKGKSAVIFGGGGSGKTTLLEALIRASIAEGLQQKRIVYMPVVSEMDFAPSDHVLTIETSEKEDKYQDLFTTTVIKPDMTFVEEIRTPAEMNLVLDLMLMGHQVIFTTHAPNKEGVQEKMKDLLERDKVRSALLYNQDLSLIKTERYAVDLTRRISLE